MINLPTHTTNYSQDAFATVTLEDASRAVNQILHEDQSEEEIKIHKLTNDNKQVTTLGIKNKYGQKYQLTVIDSPVYSVEEAHGHFFVESKNN